MPFFPFEQLNLLPSVQITKNCEVGRNFIHDCRDKRGMAFSPNIPLCSSFFVFKEAVSNNLRVATVINKIVYKRPKAEIRME